MLNKKNACFIVFFQNPFVLDTYIQQDSKIYFCTLSLYVLHTYFGIYVKFRYHSLKRVSQCYIPFFISFLNFFSIVIATQKKKTKRSYKYGNF